MTAAPMTLPGSRVIHGWWRELSGIGLRRLWFAHLLLTRLEVLAEISSPPLLATLAHALLPILARQPAPFHRDALADQLQIDPGLLADLLHELARSGAIRRRTEDGAETWEAIQSQAGAPPANVTHTRQERRSFFFTAEPPVVFLPLAVQATTPIAPEEGWRADLSVLAGCIEQAPEWKAQHGFPPDVVRFSAVAGIEEANWRTVPLARAEQALLALAETETGLLGFPVRLDGWSMGAQPVLSLPGGAAALAPLLDEVGAEAWKQSWQAWCQQRSIPPAEADACKLELVGHRLQVRAPARLVERLRTARSDALKGEAWLLAGVGRVRPAALIDLGETL